NGPATSPAATPPGIRPRPWWAPVRTIPGESMWPSSTGRSGSSRTASANSPGGASRPRRGAKSSAPIATEAPLVLSLPDFDVSESDGRFVIAANHRGESFDLLIMLVEVDELAHDGRPDDNRIRRCVFKRFREGRLGVGSDSKPGERLRR